MQMLTNPPYSTDLGPCDFFVFRSGNNRPRGKRFARAEDAVTTFTSRSLKPQQKANGASAFRLRLGGWNDI